MSVRRISPPPLNLLSEVPTPALVVDMPTARRNNRRAAAALGPGQILRPHFKAHKTTALARMQRETGAPSICCQTSWEAVALANAGFADIMVTNQIVDAAAINELVLAARLSRVSAVIDCVAHVDRLASAAQRAGERIDVLVEVDIGMRRCGVPPDSDDLLDLASVIAARPSLRFIGIQAYDGHVTGMPDPTARRAAAERSAQLTALAARRLREAGHEVPVIAGCGSGHLPFIAEIGVWTDIQAGSYLVMDGAYGDCPDLDYDVALFALATVIHRSRDRAVLDLGLKHLAVDRGPPVWLGDPAAELRLSDEHTVVSLSPSSSLGVGDRTFVLPRHIDPTINLHASLWLCDEGQATEHPVDGRMPSGRAAGHGHV